MQQDITEKDIIEDTTTEYASEDTIEEEEYTIEELKEIEHKQKVFDKLYKSGLNYIDLNFSTIEGPMTRLYGYNVNTTYNALSKMYLDRIVHEVLRNTSEENPYNKNYHCSWKRGLYIYLWDELHKVGFFTRIKNYFKSNNLEAGKELPFDTSVTLF